MAVMISGVAGWANRLTNHRRSMKKCGITRASNIMYQLTNRWIKPSLDMLVCNLKLLNFYFTNDYLVRNLGMILKYFYFMILPINKWKKLTKPMKISWNWPFKAGNEFFYKNFHRICFCPTLYQWITIHLTCLCRNNQSQEGF